MTDEIAEPSPPTPRREHVAPVPRRIRVAEWFAFAGLIAGLVGALGPAAPQQATYSWPPAQFPSGRTPTTVYYTPLLLTSRTPQRLAATLPCVPLPPLPNATEPLTVISTARFADRTQALVVASAERALTVRVGRSVLTRLPLEQGDQGVDCVYRLVLEGARWSVSRNDESHQVTGDLERMPFVNGLFSGVDLTESPQPSVEVTTRTHQVVPSARQVAAWILAAGLGLVSLILVAWPARRSPPPDGTKRERPKGHVVDAFVLGVLCFWWAAAPALFDDGWTIARQTAYTTAGGFTNYYESFGAYLPLGFWLEWAQHWITTSTDALVLQRTPALLCLAATWLVCRWTLWSIVGHLGSWRASVPWALALAFLAVAMAWAMSLRQEPAVALIVTAIVAVCVRFERTRSPAALASAAGLLALAVTAHPTGLIALAPLVAIAPTLGPWIRRQPATAVALLAASGALALTLAFVGSDLQNRGLDARTLSEFSTTAADWRRELARYTAVTEDGAADFVGYAAPLRRGAIAVIALTSLAYLLRRRRERELVDLPARALLIALLLFVATPSKWPWHFGALLGVGALVAACETWRWRRDVHEIGVPLARGAAALAGLTAAILWSWSPRGSWNAVDLRVLDWTPSVERFVSFTILAALLPLGLVLTMATRRGGAPARSIPGRIMTSSIPCLVLPLIVFTLAILTVDTVRANSWTQLRGSYASLTGNPGCGLGDELEVPEPGSVRSLVALDGVNPAPGTSWAPEPPAPGLDRFELGPADRTTVMTPWYRVPRAGEIGLFISGRPQPSDRLEIQWGRSGSSHPLRTESIAVRPTQEEDAATVWRLVARPSLEAVPEAANTLRVALVNDGRPGGSIAVTSPVTLERVRLSSELTGRATLVLPHALTFVPCAALPVFEGGVVEVPDSIVSTRGATPLLLDPATSPFRGVLDIYSLQPQPVTPVAGKPVDLVVYRLDRSIPGGRLVPPDSTGT